LPQDYPKLPDGQFQNDHTYVQKQGDTDEFGLDKMAGNGMHAMLSDDRLDFVVLDSLSQSATQWHLKDFVCILEPK
jgi:hypothetical protein